MRRTWEMPYSDDCDGDAVEIWTQNSSIVLFLFFLFLVYPNFKIVLKFFLVLLSAQQSEYILTFLSINQALFLSYSFFFWSYLAIYLFNHLSRSVSNITKRQRYPIRLYCSQCLHSWIFSDKKYLKNGSDFWEPNLK